MANAERMAKVGVLLDRNACDRRWALGVNVFEVYIEEILNYAGIPYTLIDSVEGVAEARPDVLLAAVVPENRATAAALLDYAGNGGAVIAYGGINCLSGRLGYRKAKECLEGYVELGNSRQASERLRFLSATPWIKDADAAVIENAKPTGEDGSMTKESPDGESLGCVLQYFSVGEGTIDRWSVNIPLTVACLQQGTKPVFEDGDPAPDGFAKVNEGILKTDDVMELDWKWDRQTSPGTPYPYFQTPYADLWREALIGHLLRKVLSMGLTLPFVGSWPEGVSNVALISLDSDHNINDEAWTTLELLKECGIPATWCMCVPGYEPRVYEQVKKDGHELALHYNAVNSEGFVWGEESFRSQLNWLRGAIGEHKIVSNKNHVTREEGWGDLFVWCEAEGVESDQTRGPSKKGNGGFICGTCLPYFPVAWANEKNRFYDVVQVAFLLSDFNHMGTDTHIPILKQASRVGGVAHIVMHQTHLHTKEIDREWLRAIVKTAREMDFVFWTGEQINNWERARRKVRIAGLGGYGEVVLSDGAPEGTVVYVPVAEASASDRDGEFEVRYGVKCKKMIQEV